MRYSVKTTLMLCAVVAVAAAIAGTVIRLDPDLRADLFLFVGSVGILSLIIGAGTAIAWLAAKKTSWLPVNLWPGLVFSVPNWAFYALVRSTLYMTSTWGYDQDKAPGLWSMEHLAAHYFFEVVAIGLQLAIVLSLRSRNAAVPVWVGTAALIFWISVVCLELWYSAVSGIRLGGLSG